MEGYELAYRMQMQVPGILTSIKKMSRRTRCTASARTLPMHLAANACWPAGSSSAAYASFNFMPGRGLTRLYRAAHGNLILRC